MKTFQIVLIGIFIFFIAVAVFVFATFRGSGPGGQETVVLWGTLPDEQIERTVQRARVDLDREISVSYREIAPNQFDTELVEAIASGRGPDLILLPQDLIIRHQDKVIPIPFDSLSERDFRDRFIEEGELYLTDEGMLGLPFSVDPLVLYWNRTLFANEGIAQPPSYWDELFGLSNRLSIQDDTGNILQSTIAFGEYDNIRHAKEILSALILQAGNPIIETVGGERRVTLEARRGFPEVPAESALRFYTEFTNPVKQTYSWNRALPESRQMFLAGDVAMYVGFASELLGLQERNPNLNFDVAPLPQVRGAVAKKTFADMHALAILRSTPNTEAAFNVAGILTSEDVLRVWEEETGLPPVRRGLLVEEPTDAYASVFYDGAVIADAFPDPNPIETESIFEEMIESVTSGRARISEAVNEAHNSLKLLLP